MIEEIVSSGFGAFIGVILGSFATYWLNKQNARHSASIPYRVEVLRKAEKAVCHLVDMDAPKFSSLIREIKIDFYTLGTQEERNIAKNMENYRKNNKMIEAGEALRELLTLSRKNIRKELGLKPLEDDNHQVKK